jgi:hypothetical protein
VDWRTQNCKDFSFPHIDIEVIVVWMVALQKICLHLNPWTLSLLPCSEKESLQV